LPQPGRPLALKLQQVAADGSWPARGSLWNEEDRWADCDGDQAAVAWSAQTRLTDGGTEDLAEASLLCFSADGLVLEHRDFWVQG
jgi:hypothetical protein